MKSKLSDLFLEASPFRWNTAKHLDCHAVGIFPALAHQIGKIPDGMTSKRIAQFRENKDMTSRCNCCYYTDSFEQSLKMVN